MEILKHACTTHLRAESIALSGGEGASYLQFPEISHRALEESSMNSCVFSGQRSDLSHSGRSKFAL